MLYQDGQPVARVQGAVTFDEKTRTVRFAEVVVDKSVNLDLTKEFEF